MYRRSYLPRSPVIGQGVDLSSGVSVTFFLQPVLGWHTQPLEHLRPEITKANGYRTLRPVFLKISFSGEAKTYSSGQSQKTEVHACRVWHGSKGRKWWGVGVGVGVRVRERVWIGARVAPFFLFEPPS